MGEGGSRGTGLDQGCGCDRPQDEMAALGVARSQTSCEGSADRIYWCGMRGREASRMRTAAFGLSSRRVWNVCLEYVRRCHMVVGRGLR